MTYRLAVDLGTTFTAAAIAADSQASMLGLGNRALQIPSVLFLTNEGEFLVGDAAERRGLVDPTRLVREFKRRLGDGVEHLIDGHSFSTEYLMGVLLGWVVKRATERMGRAPSEIVLTHPANWGPHRVGLLEQATRIAGISPVSLCAEPVAVAAFYSTRSHVALGDRVAVYDLGGGTFDFCILEKTLDSFSIVGQPQGAEDVGGVDFDSAIFHRVLGSLQGRGWEPNERDPPTMLGLARLRRDCVDAKEALSADVETVVSVVLPGLSTSVRVTRAEVEQLIRASLVETVGIMGRALRLAGIEASTLTAVVLVGGSSHIPLVSELLQQTVGVPVALDVHPKHDVALGALLVATEPAPHPPARTVDSPTQAEVHASTPAERDTPTPASRPVPTPPAHGESVPLVRAMVPPLSPLAESVEPPMSADPGPPATELPIPGARQSDQEQRAVVPTQVGERTGLLIGLTALILAIVVAIAAFIVTKV